MMKLVSDKEYLKDLKQFTKTHGGVSVYSSPMMSKTWQKTYTAKDGASFHESNSIVVDEIEFDYRGQHFTTRAKFYVTEYWSSDYKESKYVFICI